MGSISSMGKKFFSNLKCQDWLGAYLLFQGQMWLTLYMQIGH